MKTAYSAYVLEYTYLTFEAQGYTRADADALVETAYGMTMADYVSTLCETAFADMGEELSDSSMYAIDGNKLYSPGAEENYEIFTIPHYATGIHITEKGLDYLENYVKEVRDEIGYEVPLAIDHFGHVAIEDAIRFAKRLEKYNIAWMEDLAPWHQTNHLKKFAENSCVPLCTGEDIYLAENFEKVMQAGVNVIHPDMLTIGGFMEMKKVGALCEKYGVALAIHMAESPIGFMAAVHAAAALKNVLAVEFHSVDHPEWYELVNPIIKLENGFMNVPNTPGLGIESLNEELIEKFRKADCDEPWKDTSEWDKEWSNDREWS
jgi:L-alanine-DL-glutamate epimerase-like enolase superfamily enzyme